MDSQFLDMILWVMINAAVLVMTPTQRQITKTASRIKVAEPFLGFSQEPIQERKPNNAGRLSRPIHLFVPFVIVQKNWVTNPF